MSAVGYDVLNIARSEEPVQLILGYFYAVVGGGVSSPQNCHI